MKNLAKFSLTLLAAGLLAGCGSSGGGGDNSLKADTSKTTPADKSGASTQTTPADKPSTGTQTKPTDPSNNTDSTKNATNDDDMGEAFRVSDGEDFDLKKANLNTWKTELVVDGKKIPITLGTGIYSGTFTDVSNSRINGVYYEQFLVSGLKYADVKFGAVNGYVFAQGNVTPDSAIPTTGKATYSVDGVLVQNGVATISEGHSLTADFANKTINGTVFNGVTVTNARIDGNDFSGKAVYKGAAADLDGHFYGANAGEIGGAYGSAGFSGAFGGKKQ